ncbi:MAG: hypothetical protein JSS34_03375 [Proteobacteria bacterium]|nr:hypothetical protein [Pseudomonadota bacterium]
MKLKHLSILTASFAFMQIISSEGQATNALGHNSVLDMKHMMYPPYGISEIDGDRKTQAILSIGQSLANLQALHTLVTSHVIEHAEAETKNKAPAYNPKEAQEHIEIGNAIDALFVTQDKAHQTLKEEAGKAGQKLAVQSLPQRPDFGILGNERTQDHVSHAEAVRAAYIRELVFWQNIAALHGLPNQAYGDIGLLLEEMHSAEKEIADVTKKHNNSTYNQIHP